jgi:glutamate-1-semialdehyde 2,1-aminomutase
MPGDRHEKSREWFERALRVVPGGIYGHQSPALLTRGHFPYFLDGGNGCRIRDVDGNEYIDFMCAYGPMVVGYGNVEVERAAAEQRARGDTGNLPSPVFVELAERLVSLTPGSAWATFGKNGSDVCTWAIAVARQATSRDIVVKVEGAYHGVHDWCNAIRHGFLESDRSSIRSFPWNDLDALSRLFSEAPNAVAAVIVTPFRHDVFADLEMPAPGFLEGVREITRRHGAVMIVDDVRAGFRLHIGGSTQLWGVTPDLLAYSKALANGYPLSALVGSEPLRSAASEVFVTGSFFTQAVPLRAALATLDVLEKTDAIARIDRAGRRFTDGLRAQADRAKLEVTVSGPPAIPFMTFVGDTKFRMSRAFAGACADHGVFLHPTHNWFVSAAHADADIDAALAATDRAFHFVAEEFPDHKK